ncbi:Peptidase S45, penicillin amidase [Xenorhabdus mauleonii]|uniref:Acyl-homoserine-lactone acylase n=1 Tax=Xenorhabdus mauleonii TaxID=351675 RepID=A0A1I3VRP9_9GAMM|nr:penicillin acylase family protein [Xenorhabdus mauleonii]PHM38398.1 Peptidase S45, penicillin amidase [Xenorhabdus mauleonii]SFJ97832.1 acyl-homoserine-lactone acylase [Xenorhabdus mauleonii]
MVFERIKIKSYFRIFILIVSSSLLSACFNTTPINKTNTYAEIRRTSFGIPHIKAENWFGLGYGYGYAQVQDNLCTMADSFLTYRGERSLHFGGQATLVYDGIIGKVQNLDSDFYHRHILAEEMLNRMIQSQSKEIKQLVSGFTAGYNQYLRELPLHAKAHQACRNQEWVQPIDELDIYRRMYAALFAKGYNVMLTNIVNAQPPGILPTTDISGSPASTASFHLNNLESKGVGSNAYGFGTQATRSDSPLLVGNPHWYWFGPDLFYQAQLTIPGEINVSGVSFLGIPVIQIGFNENIAWSHTVSTASRMGFYELSLAPDDPLSYLRDGKKVKMEANTITVQVKQDAGSVVPVTRTLYKSEYGPLVNLSPLQWDTKKAFAVRDINQENFRAFRNWLRFNQARSLEEFITIQKQESAMPWVNTIAIGRGSNEAWYADMGPVPNVSPEQTKSCTMTSRQVLAAQLTPDIPFFDGSRSECDWQNDPDSVQNGAVGSSRMPNLLRADYVANMNDSYWLTNPQSPLTGYPAAFGSAGSKPISMRTRLGHIMVQERLQGHDRYSENAINNETMQEMVLNSRALTAELFKSELLEKACHSPLVDVQRDVLNDTTFPSPQRVDVTEACHILKDWDNSGNISARGAHIWDGIWNRLQGLPESVLFAIPFDKNDPLNTPRKLHADKETLRQALGATVLDLAHRGLPLNAQRGDYVYLVRGDKHVPLYGGCSNIGYFTIACVDAIDVENTDVRNKYDYGNSYTQLISFPNNNVEAYTSLLTSLSDDPASLHYSDSTWRYSAKQWLRLPFKESEIIADPGYQSLILAD